MDRSLSMRRLALVMGVVAAVAFAACNESGTTEPPGQAFMGSFTATFTGVVNKTISGVAIFGSGTDPSTGESAWVAYLPTDSQNPQVSNEVIYFMGPGAPNAQSYVLSDLNEDPEVPPGGAGALVFATEGGLPTFFASDGGSFQITNLSTTMMEGTFNIDATGTLIEPGGQAMEGSVNVQGTFQAEGGQFLLPG